MPRKKKAKKTKILKKPKPGKKQKKIKLEPKVIDKKNVNVGADEKPEIKKIPRIRQKSSKCFPKKYLERNFL